MKPELDRFLRDCCEVTSIRNLSGLPGFPLEYAIAPNILGCPGWGFWLKFNLDYSGCIFVSYSPDEDVEQSQPIGTEFATVAWVLESIEKALDRAMEGDRHAEAD